MGKKTRPDLGDLWANEDEVLHVVGLEGKHVRVRSLQESKIRVIPVVNISKEFRCANDLWKVPYRRWQSREHGFEVEVVNVLNGATPMSTQVQVDRTRFVERHDAWPILNFLGQFRPLGTKIRRKSLWQRLRSV